MAAVMGCGGTGLSPGQAWQVETVDEHKAQVVEVGTQRARVVDRQALPPGAREGDVVVDGRLDPELRAQLAREVAEQRARLAVPVPRELDL
jgi:electron transfer flavoprotein alpha/beta subunit